jgi:glycosyltransferase involved in cell wall biosynthesis
MNKNNQLVGIVLCSYNPKLDLVAKQIDSLKRQTHTNFICWIVDDVSEKRKVEYIISLISNDSRFKLVVNSNNQKPYLNFENGIRKVLESNPDFISLCDQDDIWNEDKISKQLDRLLGTEFQITSCDLEIVDENLNVIRQTLRKGIRSSNPIDLLVANDIAGASILMSKDFALKSLPFPRGSSNLYHDHWLGIIGASLQVLDIDNTVLYKFVQHGGNSSGDRKRNDWDSLINCFAYSLRTSVRYDFFLTRKCILKNLEKSIDLKSFLIGSRVQLLANIIKPGISGDRRIGSILFIMNLRKYLFPQSGN